MIHRKNDRYLARIFLAMASLLVLLAWVDTSWSLAQDTVPPIDATDIQDVMQDQPPAVVTSKDNNESGIDLLTLVTRGGGIHDSDWTHEPDGCGIGL